MNEKDRRGKVYFGLFLEVLVTYFESYVLTDTVYKHTTKALLIIKKIKIKKLKLLLFLCACARFKINICELMGAVAI